MEICTGHHRVPPHGDEHADDVDAWIYCMTQTGTRLIKFGFTSRSPRERARDGTLGPAPLQVVKAWASPDAALLERLVLRRLSHARVRGEWLALGIEDITEVVEITAAAHGIDLMPR
jgi:hypothetical protein